ncbi:MAG: dienelactone hydrolase [Planctomycetes bacterium]|nr:dienelactone hydrolase [Planctomycetota bacterium]
MRCLLLSVLLLPLLRGQTVPDYDPLALPATAPPPSFTDRVVDAARDRTVPVRVFLPAGDAAAPVLLFSHGLGGTRDTCNYLGVHWARRGYAVVFLQHPGSDDSVWRGLPLRERMPAMQAAASPANLVLRAEDVTAVLDALRRWHDDAAHRCHGRLDLDHVGMAGHSFGAMTTQVAAGQRATLGAQRLHEPRIDAALPMSPSVPLVGDATRAFAAVAVPMLLMTGTHDGARIGGQTPASRRGVFPALPLTIDRYELVLEGAEHSAFTERALPGDQGRRNPDHHRAILALSTAFWDTHLRGDAAARAWLHGDGARTVLAAGDRWQVAAAAPAAAQPPSADTSR